MSDPTPSPYSPTPTTPALAPASDSPGDRATTFQAVQGPQPEHYSGEVLLVSAYALVWVILLFWVSLVWRKQSELGTRLADLEREIDKAAATKPDR